MTASSPTGYITLPPSTKVLLDRTAGHEPDLATRAEHLASPEGITRQASTFVHRDVVREWAAAHRDGADASRLEALTDRWLSSGHAIRLDRDPDIERSRYSTPDLLATEQRLLEQSHERRGMRVACADIDAVDRACDAAPRLSFEQRAAVQSLTGSGHGVQVVRAAAGTGKTTMLSVARNAWEADGHRVYGCALSARAALELESGSGIDSGTIAGLRQDLDHGHQLPKDSVLVVDEAGMVGTRDLAALADHATAADAKLVLVGDDHQLPEIQAGGAFRALADRLDAIELHEVFRQRHDWDKTALDHLRHGRVDEWAAAYREHDRLTALPTAEAVRERLVADWFTAHQEPSTDAVMLAHRRADVTDLNDRARQHLHSTGQLDTDELRFGTRSFSVGDHVLARRNDRQLGIVNGTRATVTAIDQDSRTVEIDHGPGERTTVGSDYCDAGHLHHGYAITAHAAQGITVDQTYVLGTDDLYREWGYTALTRHTEAARFYTVTPSSTERELGRENGISEEEQLLGHSRAKHLALDQADAAELLISPPYAITHEIGDKPESPLGREQWTRAARNILRRPHLDLDVMLPAPGPADDLDMDMGW